MYVPQSDEVTASGQPLGPHARSTILGLGRFLAGPGPGIKMFRSPVRQKERTRAVLDPGPSCVARIYDGFLHMISQEMAVTRSKAVLRLGSVQPE